MLTVYEIFPSIEGESSTAGLPAVFVRLSGCDLRCSWCDTRYAYEGGREMKVDDVVSMVSGFNIPRVVVTGGEPLIQDGCLDLIARLAEIRLDVYLETSGAHDIGGVDKRAVVRLDIKPPSSGMTGEMRWDNIDRLKPADEVKIVIADETDYKWACGIIEKYDLVSICRVNLTPLQDSLDPALLARWIITDGLDVRLNLQLHKIIWAADAEGV